MDFKQEVLAKIKEFKAGSFGLVCIKSSWGQVPCQLLFLTADCSSDRHLMGLLGRWRKENEMWYLSQFPVTIERTTKWFNTKLIDAPDRLLFIIKAGHSYIGHVGLFRFNFDNKSCEIDNILRGEKDYPGLISDAIKNMMLWGRDNLGLVNYTLKVLSDNERAMRLYLRLGFHETGRIPLVQAQGSDGLEWQEAPEGYAGEVKRYYVEMSLA